jgi:cobalt/nickel transport protein
MKKGSILTAILLSFQILSSPCLAHFGMIIPSDSMVMQGESKTVKLTLSFSHPFEGQGLELDRPREFGVRNNGKKQNLIETLKKTRVMEHSAWAVAYKIKRPGIYMFYMEPQPYWEAAEDTFIIHYTKTVVAAFGDDEGWDEEIGLKTEIIPLCKPFGLYAGNVFQGIVKFNGKAVPFAEVEVEYYNMGAKMTAPTAYMIAQTIKADQNGVFTYAAPVAGWWGFAALNPADFKLHHNGKNKDVELGAVIWVKFHDWQSR